MTEEYKKNVKDKCILEYGWADKEATERVDEFFDKFIVIKRYLKDYNANICSPSEIIDKVWHIALLFTMKYRLMCGDIFIEHNPMSDVSKNSSRYRKTIETYTKLFKKNPPDNIWDSLDHRPYITVNGVEKKITGRC